MIVMEGGSARYRSQPVECAVHARHLVAFCPGPWLLPETGVASLLFFLARMTDGCRHTVAAVASDALKHLSLFWQNQKVHVVIASAVWQA